MFEFESTDLAFLGVIFIAISGSFLYTVVLPLLLPLRYKQSTHILAKEIPTPEDAESPVIDL